MPPAERRQRALTDDDVKALGDSIAMALVSKLADPDIVQKVTAIAGQATDVMVGRGFKKIAMYVVVSLITLGAAKLHLGDLMDRIFK
jgi:uncharacterized protein YwlG (UPF0340 family)